MAACAAFASGRKFVEGSGREAFTVLPTIVIPMKPTRTPSISRTCQGTRCPFVAGANGVRAAGWTLLDTTTLGCGHAPPRSSVRKDCNTASLLSNS